MGNHGLWEKALMVVDATKDVPTRLGGLEEPAVLLLMVFDGGREEGDQT